MSDSLTRRLRAAARVYEKGSANEALFNEAAAALEACECKGMARLVPGSLEWRHDRLERAYSLASDRLVALGEHPPTVD